MRRHLENSWLQPTGGQKGVTFINFSPRVAIVNCDRCTDPLRRQNAPLNPVCPTRRVSELLLLHGKATSYTSLLTAETITNFEWTLLTHPT
jgi:hypothetical protein